ncbi:DNA-processing protein DprA [Patescibacteria group bacterium]|nr:DNA-processing protein DprA [Patescibacteria group bacterium]
MANEYRYLWAQWGILDYEKYQIIQKQFGDLESAWKKIDRLFLMRLGFGQEKVDRLFAIQKTIQFQRLEDFDVRILCVDDEDYPKCLKSIASPPVFLFVRGKLPPLYKALGVVGTRDITDYGRMTTEKFVSDLTLNGFVIVSGLALGVDACTHETTLRNNGITIAVLGSGVDRVYPAANRYLAEKILQKGGVILSEYPLGTPAAQHHFPMRNRIISGLSRGVLIVEGGVKSGALITARYALEQGREVFAIPNNITKIGLSGTNHLIRRSEAKLVESVEHILEEFQMQSHVSKQPITFSAIESELLERIINDGKGIDELVLETPYNVARLSEVLITLQLKGVVREIGQKWVII